MAHNTDSYFVVLDRAPIKGSPTPTYSLSYGSPEEAVGVHVASAHTIRALLSQLPDGEPVYRVYLDRTDGKTGAKRIR